MADGEPLAGEHGEAGVDVGGVLWRHLEAVVCVAREQVESSGAQQRAALDTTPDLKRVRSGGGAANS